MLSAMRVLYVEDDEDVRLLMQAKLSRIAHTCEVACDGREGLSRFFSHEPDIVVTDLQMPDIDGLALASAIRSASPDTPIIMTTAHGDAEYLLKAIELGIEGYVIKPIKFDLLRNALEKCASALYMKRELARQHEELQRLYAEDREDQAIANSILRQLLHNRGLNDPAIETHVQPTREFSGDFIAAARAPDGSLTVMLADVTGHGLQAAIFLLPIGHAFYSRVALGDGVADIARDLNRVMREFNVPGRFIAAVIARIDPRSRCVELWNGGIPDTYFINSGSNSTHVFASHNLPLGILDDGSFLAEIERHVYDTPGRFFVCSDGLSEATNAADEPFGMRGILAALSTSHHPRQALLDALRAHLGDNVPHDDVSLIVVECGKV